MLLAVDPLTEERIRARPGLYAVCPGCQKDVIPRCGDFKIWHWAHKAGICKYDSEPYTAWHLEWQEKALNAGMEIEKIFDPSQRYRADIYDPKKNIVTEVQHSPITMETIVDRCLFYDSKGIEIRWIFDFTYRYNSRKIELNETYYANSRFDYGGTYGPPIQFKQKYQPKHIHCLFDKNGLSKCDVNFNIEIDYDKHTHTTLNVIQLSPDGTGRGKLCSSMIVEEQLIIPSYILGNDDYDFPGTSENLLLKYKFEKVDNNKYIRKNELICNVEESIVIIEKIDRHHTRIKYKGYKESNFLNHIYLESLAD